MSRCSLRLLLFQMAPEDYPFEKQQPLNHEKGFKEITKVTPNPTHYYQEIYQPPNRKGTS